MTAALIFRIERRKIIMVRRLTAILLLLALAAVSCGGLDYLHRLEHEREAVAAGQRAPIPVTPPANGGRDEANCITCFTLHVPLLAQTIYAAVAGLAILAMAVNLPPHRLVMAGIPRRIDCRGPPQF